MSYIEQKKNWETFRKQLITEIWLQNYCNPSYQVSDKLEINQDFDILILLTNV